MIAQSVNKLLNLVAFALGFLRRFRRQIGADFHFHLRLLDFPNLPICRPQPEVRFLNDGIGVYNLSAHRIPCLLCSLISNRNRPLIVGYRLLKFLSIRKHNPPLQIRRRKFGIDLNRLIQQRLCNARRLFQSATA
jgi:hypothetical protein